MSARPTFRPVCELLESRELPATSITAYAVNGNLVVTGTAGNDYINVSQANGRLSVYGTQIRVGNSLVGSIAAGGVTQVIINDLGGNDTIVATTVSKPETITAGNGNDSIRGGSGGDTIQAGSGNDLIYGGAGNDHLSGGAHATLIGGGGFDWFYHPYNPATPVIGGASPTDIHQGDDPLCQTDAALAEAALQGHNFANDIKYLGGNTYEVKLYGGLPAQKVVYNGWTTVEDPTVGANGEFWFVLMQRARLQAFGIDPTKQYSQAQWDAFNQKTGGLLYSISDALYNFTGSNASYSAASAINAKGLQSALTSGAYVLAQSAAGGSINSNGILRDHAYAVLAVYENAGVWKVRLYNPWGTDEGNGKTLDESAPADDDGIITLTWQQFTNSANFAGVYVARKK